MHLPRRIRYPRFRWESGVSSGVQGERTPNAVLGQLLGADIPVHGSCVGFFHGQVGLGDLAENALKSEKM
jgi:hypothetical protein